MPLYVCCYPCATVYMLYTQHCVCFRNNSANGCEPRCSRDVLAPLAYSTACCAVACWSVASQHCYLHHVPEQCQCVHTKGCIHTAWPFLCRGPLASSGLLIVFCCFQVGSWYDTFNGVASRTTGQPLWDAGTATFTYRNVQNAAQLWYHDHV